jgi:ABC-type transport system substrate-binding protein
LNRTLLPLLALSLVIAGCGKGNFSKQATKTSSTTFRYAIHTAPTTLDPGRVQDVDTGDLMQNLYEGLVSYGEDNKIQPQLAESWTVEDDGRSYVFKLRPGIKFHNGREVTAEDVKWSLERNTNPKLNSPTSADYLADIVGVKERISGKSETINGVTVVDPRTVKITLDKPRPYFLGKLTYPCAFVLAKEAAPPTEIATVAQSVGTGPFKLEKIVPDQEVTLTANLDYYLGAPAIARIQRPIIKDAATRLNKYKNGELDLVTLERQDVAGVEADPNLKAQLKPIPRPAVYYVAMNQGQYKPFRDVRVRKAFFMAIDRNKIASEVIKLPVAKGFVPPGVMGYREALAGVPFDPTQAKKLLAEAGYPNGKGLPPLVLTYREGRPDSELLAVSAITDLGQNLGIKVTSRKMEWRSLLEARNAGKLPFFSGSWYADYLDPQNFLSFLMTSDSTMNNDSYRNPEFDRLCAEADTSLDEAKRIALYQQAEDILLQDAARIPVYYGQDMIMVSPRVTGVRTNLFGQMSNAKVAIQ